MLVAPGRERGSAKPSLHDDFSIQTTTGRLCTLTQLRQRQHRFGWRVVGRFGPKCLTRHQWRDSDSRLERTRKLSWGFFGCKCAARSSTSSLTWSGRFGATAVAHGWATLATARPQWVLKLKREQIDDVLIEMTLEMLSNGWMRLFYDLLPTIKIISWSFGRPDQKASPGPYMAPGSQFGPARHRRMAWRSDSKKISVFADDHVRRPSAGISLQLRSSSSRNQSKCAE